MRLWLVASIVAGVIAVAGRTPSTRVVYMVEDEDGRQIALAAGDGTGQVSITAGPRWHLYPDIDSPGEQVAYVEGPDARHLGVKVLHLATGRLESWTAEDGQNLHPDFSGDGRWLAYSGPLGPGGRAASAILDLRRERERAPATPSPHVIQSEHACYFPALSSDGRLVAFHRSKQDAERDVVVYDLDREELVEVSPPDGMSMAPAFSFDDSRVAYSRKTGTGWDLFVCDWRARRTVRVTDDPGSDLAPAFRPDGSLLFASDRGGHFELYQITAEDLDRGDFRVRPFVRSDASLYAPASSGTLAAELSQSLAAPIPDPPRSSFGAAFDDGRIYLAGGHKGREHTYPPDSFMADLDVYDVATESWRRAAPRSVPCHGFQIVAHRGALFAFGGFAYSADHRPRWKSLDLIERYDMALDRWEVVGRLPRPRSSNVVAVLDGKAYLIGGWDATPRSPGDAEGRFHPEVDVFDLDSGRVWTSPHRIPDPLRRALSAVVAGSEVLLVGGLGEGSTHFELIDRVTAFDPVNGRSREWPPLPFATFAPAVAGTADGLMVFGGMLRTGPRDYRYVNHVFSLPGERTRWVHTGRYLTEPKGFSQVLPLAPGRFAVLGGHSYDTRDGDGPVPTFELIGLR
jgi:hypothetical protein